MKKFTELLEDLYASDFKEKEFMGPDGKWHKRKLRPHRVDFKNSKMRAEPAQKDSGEDVGMKEETTPYWKKPSFNKRMSALAKQERLAREKKEAEKKTVKEENMTIDEQINEVLSKDATAGDWIHDFVHSDNPKFAGKSKEKRKQMALAAYYAKQRNEEYELDEGTYSSDVERAFPGGKASGVKTHPIAPTLDRKYIKGTPENKAYKATKKPINGHPTNMKKESVQITERLKVTHEDPLVTVHDKDGLHTHANLSVANHIFQTNVKHTDVHKGPVKVKSGGSYGNVTFAISQHHAADAKKDAMKEGTIKTFKEMISQITEKSEQAKRNKTIKNMMDASKGAQFNRASGLNMKPSDTGHETAQQMNKALGRALRKEEVKVNDTMHPAGAALLKHIKPEHHNLYKPHLANDTFNGSFADRHAVLTAAKQAGHLKEAKDEGEYGYEGDMAMSQLKTICRHAEHFMSMLKPDTDLPEWVQSKITLATDYIQTAHDYMMSEMNEELKGGQTKLDKNHNGKLDSQDFKILRGDKMKEETCPVCHQDPCECTVKEGRQMKLRSGVVKMHPNGVESDTEEGWETPEPAGGKTKKEFKESAEKRTVSFSDFINEIKMADLPRRTIKGSSYGAQYHDPEGDDAFDHKPKQVAKSEPAVKRGRGRPAGSKSGANQKVTSGTKRTGVDYTGYKLHLPNTNR